MGNSCNEPVLIKYLKLLLILTIYIYINQFRFRMRFIRLCFYGRNGSFLDAFVGNFDRLIANAILIFSLQRGKLFNLNNLYVLTILGMCGRTGLSLNKEHLQCASSYKPMYGESYIKPEWLHEHNNGKEYTPSYNIAPTDVTPVLMSSSKYKSAKTDRILKPMMWGIIPPWHKGDYRTHSLSTNNCRIENIRSSKLYNPILLNGGRCVIIAEGYYEWQTTIKTKVKQPYYIYARQDTHIKIDEPDSWSNSFDEKNGWKGVNILYMAGLYNIWQDNDKIIYSYSVITMDSDSSLNWLHHRMPAILDTEMQIQAWLDIDNVNPDMALSYLHPSKILQWHQVSTSVNNSRYKLMDCNKRIHTENKKQTQSSLTSFFSRVDKRKISEDEQPNKKKCNKK